MTRRGATMYRIAGTLVLAALFLPAGAAAAPLGFSISVDGQHVAGDPAPKQAAQRKTDLALAETDIEVKFDGLGVAPMLNVLPANLRSAYRAGETVDFVLDANYPAWIARAEIRLFEPGTDKLVAVIPAKVNGTTSWAMTAEGGPDFAFVARVYDADGRYDETKPLLLHRTQKPADEAPDRDFAAAGWGKDRTAHRGISVYGGAVTVYGTEVPAGAVVRAFGEPVPVDDKGSFVIQRLLPSGEHVVDVAIKQAAGSTMVFNRAVNIPTDEWFYVAMADLTLGTRWGDGKIVAADPSEFDRVYTKGRAAFYLKGKIKGEYLLTASGDTGEGPLADMFSGVLTKDPQAVLRRIDPSDYYPVYGDDSVLVDDAPTHGKLYVRLDRGPSNVMWGDFRTVVGDSSLFRSRRVLYGTSGHYESDEVTAKGAPRSQVTAYAAQPGTLPERDVMRGTGGSAYVLRRQDLVIGSETVTIEMRSAATGLVTATQQLAAGKDYSINYMQGIVILAQPLGSSAPSAGAVSSPSGDIVNLVVQYEYTPTDAGFSDYALGGSADLWLNDHVQIGAIGLSEKNELSDNHLVGGHLRVEASDRTFAELELLRSDGAAAPGWSSTDGGLTFVEDAPVAAGSAAYGYRLNAQAALDEMLNGTFKGLAGITVEGKQAGFSTPDQQVPSDQLKAHAFADIDIDERTGLGLTYDHFGDADRRRDEAAAELSYRLTPDWRVIAGAHYLSQDVPAGAPEDNGSRGDIGFRAIYEPSDDLSLYGFAQVTALHAGTIARNDRIGAGGQYRINEQWTVSGEGSYGSGGPGALAMLTYAPDISEQTYLGFRLTPDAALDDYLTQPEPLSGIVVGTKRRFNDAVSLYAENTFGLFRDNHSLASNYGVTFTPDKRWTFDAALENGTIVDETASDFDRKALSLGAGFKDGGIDAHARGEVRLEDSADNSRDRQTYLLQSGLSWKTDDNWRLLAGVDGVISRSDEAAILDGDYIEASLGLAYRPVDNDRLNALFRYSYLYDLPGPAQVASSTGTTLGPAQRSHILSADVDYDVTPWLTLGAKYGFRIGEISASRDPKDFVPNSAHLGIVRADLRFLPDWSLLFEQRALYQPETQMLDLGSLVSVSHRFGDNFNVGVGYNFGRFSDDLKDLTYDDHGIFLNLTAKY